MDPRARGAAAGAVAAAVWAATDPFFKRTFGTPYSDSELLSAYVTRGRLQPLVSVAVHSANGAGLRLPLHPVRRPRREGASRSRSPRTRCSGP